MANAQVEIAGATTWQQGEGGGSACRGCAQGRRDVVKLLVIAALLCEMFALRVADADAQITLKRGYANTHTTNSNPLPI